MKTNDNIATEYGSFRSITPRRPAPQKYKPTPLATDYAVGYINRAAVVRRNDPASSREIDPKFSGNVDMDMYQVYTIMWRISGKRDRTVVNGIIEDIGVAASNAETVKKLGKPVERLFSNSIEFWRGY